MTMSVNSPVPVPEYLQDGYVGDSPALAGVPFGDDQAEDEIQSTTIDTKQLFRSEGLSPDWEHWRDQLLIARDYYTWRGETEMADDVDDTLADSAARHQKAMKI